MENKQKVGLYARVSDDRKNQNGIRIQDVNRQLEALRAYASKCGYTDISEYKDDGKSAFTEDWNQRLDFKRLFNDCRKRDIQIVIIEDMTRFSRNMAIGLPLLRELSELGVHLVSLKEGELEVTSSKGWMQSTVLLFFAEWDSRIKSEKVKDGMARAKEAGKKIGGFKLTPLQRLEKANKSKNVGLALK